MRPARGTTRSPAAWWWLAGVNVLGLNTTTMWWMRRAKRVEAGLTEEVGVGGVAGSGRRGGVLVEGGSDGVAAASGVVLWLEAKVWGELRALHRSGWGYFPTGGGWQHHFKGRAGGTQRRGAGGVG
jgi:hypothetical protein